MVINMARFNLSGRMEEVEYSMCAGDKCNMAMRDLKNGQLTDKDVMYVEEQEKEKAEKEKSNISIDN